MKNLTNLELLMEYMEQNQYFIGNDLLGKFNELLQKEKKEQLILSSVSQQRKPLLAYHRYLTEELSLDLKEIWVDEHLKANNCG